MSTATVAIEQQSSTQNFSSHLLNNSAGVLNDIQLDELEAITANDIELDELETIMTTELVQGLPSDTEFGTF